MTTAACSRALLARLDITGLGMSSKTIVCISGGAGRALRVKTDKVFDARARRVRRRGSISKPFGDFAVVGTSITTFSGGVFSSETDADVTDPPLTELGPDQAFDSASGLDDTHKCESEGGRHLDVKSAPGSRPRLALNRLFPCPSSDIFLGACTVSALYFGFREKSRRPNSLRKSPRYSPLLLENGDSWSVPFEVNGKLSTTSLPGRTCLDLRIRFSSAVSGGVASVRKLRGLKVHVP